AEDGLDALDAAAAERAEQREPDLRAPEPLAIHQILTEHDLAEDVQAGPEEVAPLAVQRDGHASQVAPRTAEQPVARLPVAAGQAEAGRHTGEPVLDTARGGLAVVLVQLVRAAAVEDADVVAPAADIAVQRHADLAAEVAQRIQHSLLLAQHGRAVEHGERHAVPQEREVQCTDAHAPLDRQDER